LIVSGFVTSPCDHWRIFSGDAKEMRIASKSGASCVFSCWNLNTVFISVRKKPLTDIFQKIQLTGMDRMLRIKDSKLQI
jgi:hypothetical protein